MSNRMGSSTMWKNQLPLDLGPQPLQTRATPMLSSSSMFLDPSVSNASSAVWHLILDCQKFLYGKTEEEQHAKENAGIDSQITYMFTHEKPHIHHNDERLFTLPLPQRRLNLTLNQKTWWIESESCSLCS